MDPETQSEPTTSPDPFYQSVLIAEQDIETLMSLGNEEIAERLGEALSAFAVTEQAASVPVQAAIRRAFTLLFNRGICPCHLWREPGIRHIPALVQVLGEFDPDWCSARLQHAILERTGHPLLFGWD